MRIREIAMTDVSAFTECLRLTNEESGTGGTPIDPSEVERLLRLNFRQPRQNIFVADDGGRIVGYSCVIGGLQPSDRHKGTFRIVLLSAYRGQKWGTKLTQTAIDWARQQRFHRLELTVLIGNVVAQALYHKCGFAVEGVKRAAFFDGRCFHDELIMGMVLGSDERWPNARNTQSITQAARSRVTNPPPQFDR